MMHLRSTLILTGGIVLASSLSATGITRTSAAAEGKLILSGQPLSYPVLSASSQAAWSKRGLKFKPVTMVRMPRALVRSNATPLIADHTAVVHPQDQRQRLKTARMGSVKTAVEARKTGAALKTILFTPIVPVTPGAATP